MSPTYQRSPGGYSNTNTATSIKGNTRNNRIRNHNNGSRRNNQPVNRVLENFTGEVPSFGDVLETVAKNCSMKDQFKTFQTKVKQYILKKFNNRRDVSVVIRDIKYPYSHLDIEKPINISKEDKQDVIIFTQLQDKAK